MSRLKELRNYVDNDLNRMDDARKRISAVAHLYGVSLAAAMIAKKRGLDPEIASMAAMLHDLHAYRTGSYDDHAHRGADLARNILDELKLTDGAETDSICSAIYHHDDKQVTDGPMDEVLKDADVIHHCMNDLSKPVRELERERFDKLCAEFGFQRAMKYPEILRAKFPERPNRFIVRLDTGAEGEGCMGEGDGTGCCPPL